MIPRPPNTTRTDTLFPDPPLFRSRKELGVHRHIDDRLSPELRDQRGDGEDQEAVLLVEQADEDADDDRQIEDRDGDAGDDPELLADHREDIVGVRFGKLELGEAGAGAGTDQPACGQRRMRLVDLIAVAAFEQPRSEEHKSELQSLMSTSY